MRSLATIRLATASSAWETDGAVGVRPNGREDRIYIGQTLSRREDEKPSMAVGGHPDQPPCSCILTTTSLLYLSIEQIRQERCDVNHTPANYVDEWLSCRGSAAVLVRKGAVFDAVAEAPAAAAFGLVGPEEPALGGLVADELGAAVGAYRGLCLEALRAAQRLRVERAGPLPYDPRKLLLHLIELAFALQSGDLDMGKNVVLSVAFRVALVEMGIEEHIGVLRLLHKVRPRLRSKAIMDHDGGALSAHMLAHPLVALQIVALQNIDRHIPVRLVEQFEAKEVIEAFAVSGEIVYHPQRMSNVLRTGVPAERAGPAAMIVAVLAARRSVQIQQHPETVGFRRAKRPVQGLPPGDKRRILLQHPVADR